MIALLLTLSWIWGLAVDKSIKHIW
jgi:hypothetical protein